MTKSNLLEENLTKYKAVVDLVKSRIEKARSVSRNNKNKKKFSEVDLLVKRTLDSLGGEDILKNFFDGMGEYEELILPRFRKEARIEKTLSGWQLTDGKERAFFDDKKQAVYRGILAFMGMEKVKIPQEMNEEKVKALRNIVDSVFQAINATLETVTDKKRRDAIITPRPAHPTPGSGPPLSTHKTPLYPSWTTSSIVMDLLSTRSLTSNLLIPFSLITSRTVSISVSPRRLRVQSAFGSHPIIITFKPASAYAAARFDAIVDFPMPPFP
ncbi:MAG: hypothetical protein N2V75_08775 [Methanophagales archaeon]|nr:hypothetical protein [Methanophagales archaeon]